MTLGEKIRTYRLLKGLTQKELGMMVGFSEATADSRIRKYESNAMAPKTDLRLKIANALDVDISALSDNDISSSEDVMQLLFLLEQQYGARVHRSDEKINIEFQLSNNGNELLNSYLNAWAERYSQYMTDEDDNAYLSWEAQFPGNLPLEWDTLRKKLLSKYDYLPLSNKLTLRDFAMHIFAVLKSGYKLEIDFIPRYILWAPNYKDFAGIRLAFSVDELLSASAPDDISKISQLFSDIRYIESQEYYVQYNVYQSGNGPILVLYVRDPDLSIMKKVYKEYLVGAVEADKNKPESAVRTIEEILYDHLYFLDGEIIPISGKKDKK